MTFGGPSLLKSRCDSVILQTTPKALCPLHLPKPGSLLMDDLQPLWRWKPIVFVEPHWNLQAFAPPHLSLCSRFLSDWFGLPGQRPRIQRAWGRRPQAEAWRHFCSSCLHAGCWDGQLAAQRDGLGRELNYLRVRPLTRHTVLHRLPRQMNPDSWLFRGA